MIFTEVDPTMFIDEVKQLPETGRGAWTKRGIDFSNKYALSPKGAPRIGTQAEKNLDYWATAAGTHGMRLVLTDLGITDAAEGENIGRFGTAMRDAVKEFQAQAKDPATGNALVADGIAGVSTCRALFTPLIDAAGTKNNLPEHLLRGVIYHESALDPGAVGYFIHYINYDGTTRYGGVDRGLEQNNSRANPTIDWYLAYDPRWSIADAGARLRKQYDKLKAAYPSRTDDVLWPAAVVSHNSPANGLSWAKLGAPPTTQAADYVDSVYKLIY